MNLIRLQQTIGLGLYNYTGYQRCLPENFSKSLIWNSFSKHPNEMSVVVVQCFKELQATDKTHITLQKKKIHQGQFNETSKMLLDQLPFYNTSRNNLIAKSARWLQASQSFSKTLQYILLEKHLYKNRCTQCSTSTTKNCRQHS